MTVDLSELHDDLRTVARQVIGRPPTALGALEPPALDWKALADAGLLGLTVPDAFGGAGATFAEVAVVLDELGRAPAVGPYLGSAVLATSALLQAEPGPDRDELLAGLAAGTTTAALALDAQAARVDRPPFSVASRRGDRSFSGRVEWVIDAPQVDHLLCLAHDDSGPVLLRTAGSAEGLVVAAHSLVDGTRRVGSVVADECVASSRWRLSHGASARLADLGAAAAACDALGLMEAMLELTVAYAKVRHQFGRPIGSFQAVKHACADMLVATEVSRVLVGQAVAAVSSEGSPDACRIAVARAKSHVGAAAVEVCGKALQLHGGIGYTWESGIHAFLKRATLDRALFGSPTAHRRDLVRAFPASQRPSGATLDI